MNSDALGAWLMGLKTREAEMDYDELDQGIRETVRWLRETWLYDTVDSGDGRAKLEDGRCPEGVLDYPHVHIRVAAKDMVDAAHRLKAILEMRGVRVGECTPEGGTCWIQCTYDPTDRTALVTLAGVNDAVLGLPE